MTQQPHEDVRLSGGAMVADWIKWLSVGRRGLWLALALAVLLALPTFGVGLLHDDLLHRSRILLPPDVPTSLTTLYEFLPNEMVPELKARGWMPWWTSEALEVRFFRPIPSALLFLDAAISTQSHIWMRLHSLLWLLALVAVVWRLLRRLLTPQTATLATLLLVLSGPLVMGVGWTAARYVLLVGVFGLSSLHAHVDWQQQGGLRHLLVGLGLLVVSLLCGELALGTVGLVLAYQLFGRRGEPWRARLLGMSPWLLVGLLYVGGYTLAGFGASGSYAYVDPRQAPLGYLAAVASGVPLLLCEALLKVPAAAAMLIPEARLPLVLMGLLASTALCGLVWRNRDRLESADRQHLGWLLIGGVLTLVPASAGAIGSRLLVLALPGLMVLFAVALRLCLQQRADKGARRWAWTLGAGVLLLSGVLMGPLEWLNGAAALAKASAGQWRVAAKSEGLCDHDNVLLHVSDPTVAVYTLPARALQGKGMPRSWNVVSMAPQDVRVERSSKTALRLRVKGPRRPNWWERVQRNTPWRVGEVHQVAAMRVTITEAAEDGPIALEVEFNQPLESPELCFVHWQDGNLVPWTPPAIGQTDELRYERGLLEL